MAGFTRQDFLLPLTRTFCQSSDKSSHTRLSMSFKMSLYCHSLTRTDISTETSCSTFISQRNPIRAKQKLLRRRRRVHKSFSSRYRSQKLFTQTTHWSWENHVKIYHGIIELRHLIYPRRMVLLKERYAKIKEGTSEVLLQSGLEEK